MNCSLATDQQPPTQEAHISASTQQQQQQPLYSDVASTASSSRTAPAMLQMSTSTDLSSPPDVRNISDDRIHPQPGRGRRMHTNFETTADGDVVIVQPSFEEDSSSKTPSSSPLKQRQDWNQRSPKQEDNKQGNDSEHREQHNPSSYDHTRPKQVHDAPHHSRNLSAHFFDATTINRNDSTDSADMLKADDYHRSESRKHRRLQSNDMSNPNVAHRRINSIGNAAPVARRQQQHRSHHHHHREDSAGLDILSAAVEVSGEDLARAAGEQHLQPLNDSWEPPSAPQHPPPRMKQVYEQQRPYPPPPMHPPQNRRFGNNGPPPGHYLPVDSNTPTMPPYHHQQHHPGYGNNYPPAPHGSHGGGYFPTAGFPGRPGYPVQPQQPPQQYQSQQPHRHPMHPPSQGMMYPPENRHRAQHDVGAPPEVQSKDEWGQERESSSGTNQGSQTFVTAMAVGGNKTLRPSSRNHHQTDDVPTHINQNHHRRLSSYSSLGLGTIFGSAAMSPAISTAEKDSHPLKKASHHRSTSSSVSFMNPLDVVGMEGSADATFLRNLQESSNIDFRSAPASSSAATPSKSSSEPTIEEEDDTKLAAGGTSKRVRRKCTVGNCPNRVVQGGLCISHGAKRKTCKHPGCNKNVKKAGLCSTHGPSRKRCEVHDCEKVAVQGGRCIAHGARKKLCSYEECNKQAILSGMCKKHHDEAKEETKSSSAASPVCLPVRPKKKVTAAAHKPQHTRGLSIFHDISADAVQSLLNAETVPPPAPPASFP